MTIIRRWFSVQLSKAMALIVPIVAFVGLNLWPHFTLSSSKIRYPAYGWPILLLCECPHDHEHAMMYRFDLFHKGFSGDVKLGFFVVIALNFLAAAVLWLTILTILKIGIQRRSVDFLCKGKRPRFKIRALTAFILFLTTVSLLISNFTVQEWTSFNETRWFGWPTNSAVSNRHGFYVEWEGVINNVWICALIVFAFGWICEFAAATEHR